jgi:enterochelin esterase-like enzyme
MIFFIQNKILFWYKILRMRNIFCAILILIFSMSYSQTIKVSTGKIAVFTDFKSKFVDGRTVAVWTPDGYNVNDKYPVLYLHDGQMLFDPETTWNKQSWNVDETVSKLIAEAKLKKIIVVGIWNNGDYRHSEYFPEKIIVNIPEATRKIILEEQLKNKPQSNNYLKFLVDEVKPFVDKNFSTKSTLPNTYIGGSSMGGLISLYALCEYPKTFGGAICMSTHTPMIKSEKLGMVADSDVASKFRDYLLKNLPNPENHKIYMDFGDQTLDSFYKFFQDKIDLVLQKKGYTAKNWETKFFAGDNHSEVSWANRFAIPLEFVIGK